MENISGFDDPGLFFSDNFGFEQISENVGENAVKPAFDLNKMDLKRRAMEFIRTFQSENIFIYRDTLKRNYSREMYNLEISLDDVLAFDKELFDAVKGYPDEVIPVIEDACCDMVYEVMRTGAQDGSEDEDMNGQAPNQEIKEKPHEIQIILAWRSNAFKLRQLTADRVSSLVKVSGIVVAASSVRCKAVRMTLQCRNCKTTLPNLNVNPGLEGFALPRKCMSDQTGQVKCPLDPFYVIPDKCDCVDFQQVKLQELPENVPPGEMPRHLSMYVERYLVDRVVPGNRISAIGIFAIRKINTDKISTSKTKPTVGTKSPYLRVLGIYVADVDSALAGAESGGHGRMQGLEQFSPADIEEFKQIAARKDAYMHRIK